MPNKNNLIAIAILLAGGLILSAFGLQISRQPDIAKIMLGEKQELVAGGGAFDPKEALASNFNKINIKATAAIVLDPKTGEIIYAKNIRQPLPLASITKVMTSLVASEMIANPTEKFITITAEDLAPEGDSGLVPGDVWRLSDLINLTLVVSSNDGARAIANTVSTQTNTPFVTLMNQKAVDLGLETMAFRNESGLDMFGEPGAVASVEDVARLFAYAYQTNPGIFEATRHDSLHVGSLGHDWRTAPNTNEAINQLSSVLVSKTGYTDLSGGNLAVVFDRGLNQPAVAVVLGSTQEGRFGDMLQLTQAAIADLIQNNKK